MKSSVLFFSTSVIFLSVSGGQCFVLLEVVWLLGASGQEGRDGCRARKCLASTPHSLSKAVPLMYNFSLHPKISVWIIAKSQDSGNQVKVTSPEFLDGRSVVE